ncbi:hypothetical protein LshimejAT787_0602820 [Lyophyllum shimeji]|uniref:Uncharacterized protein n=1 Tax=Lyophyllum shimeji TaxID=47721 RepID=A0A9P3PMK7_LYOSH|nr:hypothetical protein LshimejAT787_0602820 [Lyophyllum shimeji]
MKYSQAVLVACVGGAALASALPNHEHHAGTPAPAPKSRLQRAGSKMGKAAVLAGTFANKATGMTTYPSDQNSGSSVVRRSPTRGAKRTKAKDFGDSVFQGAGGGQALAENLGSIADLASQNFGDSSVWPRGPPDGDTPASTNPSSKPSPEPANPAAEAHGHHQGAHRGGGQHAGGGRKNRKQWKNMSPGEKELWKQRHRKHSSGSRHGPAPAAASVSSRDLEDEVWARALDKLDMLLARGPSRADPPPAGDPPSQHGSGPNPSGGRKHIHLTPEEKALRKQRKAAKLAGHAGQTPAPAHSHSSRDFEDLAEYLEARGIFHVLKNVVTGKLKHASPSISVPTQPTEDAAPSDPSAAPRGFLEDLDARDFYEIDELD